MIIVLGSVVAQEGRFDEALAMSREHVARSRLEPGCLAHAVHRDSDDALRLVFVEQWDTPESLWAHFKVPASRAFGQALAALASVPPTIKLFDATAMPLPGRA